MQVLETIAAFRQARKQAIRDRVAQGMEERLGFVPTMGYLHAGHISLVQQARAECGLVAASIFVNPTQFAPNEDFANYPRDMERDLSLLRAEGVQLVFAPSAATMYPPESGAGTLVEVQGVTEMLEGAARPSFFGGVATVVCKLLNIVQPTHAYFGQKDAQQSVVVRKLVQDLNIPTEIVVAPTVREPDGLAMSSRNAYLAPEERQAAPVLYRALTTAQQHYAAGERSGEALRQAMQQVLAREPLAKPEYVSVAHPLTLQELEIVGERGALLSMAVRIGPARLIDNLVLQAL